MTELLPCPFCGSAATTVEIDTNESWDYIAACNNDECKLTVHTHGFPDEPAAIAAWNTRATAAPVVVVEDTKRLDWLATQFRTCTVYMSGASLYKPGVGIQSLVGADFRSAIDAAMAAALAGD